MSNINNFLQFKIVFTQRHASQNYTVKTKYSLNVFRIFTNTTRLHSSRMRTARSLTVSPSMLCSGGVPGPGGGAWSRGVSGQGGGIQACTEADPPVNRITHTCKNITLP